MITLTSFREAAYHAHPFSGARWAPDWASHMPTLEWAKPVENGVYIRPRLFVEERYPLKAYYEALYSIYNGRLEEILSWVDTLDPDADHAIACWCPFTKAARRQYEQFGSFICHTGALSKVFATNGVEWQFGAEHRKGLARVRKEKTT